MATQRPAMALTHLIFDIGHLTATSHSLDRIPDEIARVIQAGVGASRVLISMRTRVRRRAASHLLEAAAGPAPRFLFACPIAVRGVEYGRFELDLVQPAHAADDLLLALETIVRLLAAFAEKISLEEERSVFLAEISEAGGILATGKLLARAGGIVAEMQSLPLTVAQRWIRDEARRVRVPVETLATRIVEEAAERGRWPERRLPVFKRTA